MSAIVKPEIAASAGKVLEKVREDYWSKGARTVSPSVVVESIREVRVGASCSESAMPTKLLSLLEYARSNKEQIKLSSLMLPLSEVALSS